MGTWEPDVVRLAPGCVVDYRAVLDRADMQVVAKVFARFHANRAAECYDLWMEMLNGLPFTD